MGHLIVLGVIFFLDVRWLQIDGTQRDMGATFLIGIFLHAFLINTVLLLVTGSGLWLRKRSCQNFHELKIA
jgi:hypothetical protein